MCTFTSNSPLQASLPVDAHHTNATFQHLPSQCLMLQFGHKAVAVSESLPVISVGDSPVHKSVAVSDSLPVIVEK